MWLSLNGPAGGADQRNVVPLRSESGFALMEAVFSAALLAVVAIATFGSLDVANRSAGKERTRAVAIALAEEDQQRLRSLPVLTLAGLDQTRTVNVNGATYTVRSTGAWSREQGEVSCTNGQTQAFYVIATSEVADPARRLKSPRLTSFVTPRPGAEGAAQGTFALQVIDRTGAPLPGIPVTATAPGQAARTASTNAAGCAVFDVVPAGTWTGTVDVAGYVDPGGTRRATGTASVTRGAVGVAQIQYDRAGAVRVGFDTRAFNTVLPSRATSVSAAHSSVPGTGARIVTSATPVASLDAVSLFPFPSPYGIYSGNCAGANPTASDANYWSSGRPGLVQVGPGVTNLGVTVRQPALGVRVLDGSKATSDPVVGARVVATSRSTGCTATYVLTTTDGTYTYLSGSSTVVVAGGWVTKPRSGTWSYDPGLPFGQYEICVELNGKRRVHPTLVANTNPDNNPATTVDFSKESGGSCPS